MTRHRPRVMEFIYRYLDNLVTIVTQPSPNACVLFCGGRVAVDVVAQAVEVDAYPFVVIMMRAAINDIRGVVTDGPASRICCPRIPSSSLPQQKGAGAAFSFIDRLAPSPGSLDGFLGG